MKQKKATDFDQNLLNLFDRYVHGLITRREFLDGASKFAVAGVSAAAILESLNPRYAEAQQVSEDDPRLKTESIDYPSPQGSGTMRGYLARPADSRGNLPGVCQSKRSWKSAVRLRKALKPPMRRASSTGM